MVLFLTKSTTRPFIVTLNTSETKMSLANPPPTQTGNRSRKGSIDELAYENRLVRKTILVGPVGVGKTSLVYRAAFNTFSDHYKATVSAQF